MLKNILQLNYDAFIFTFYLASKGMPSQSPNAYSPMVGDHALGLPWASVVAARLESEGVESTVQPYGVCVIV